MSYYDPSQRYPRSEPTRRLTRSQIQQIEATLQELEQEAAKWKEISRKWETAAREEHQRARQLEEQLEEQQNIALQSREQPAEEQTTSKVDPESQVLLEEAEQKLSRMEDHLARAQADYENARKRLEKRYANLLEQNMMEFLRDLLPVMDNLDRAVMHAPAGADGEGVKLTRQLFLSTLDKYGVKPIKALGQAFDPNYHEALGTVEDSDFPSGTIAAVEKPGFTFRDKLLRPAQVLVTPEE